jgi:hypothetical protein
MLEVFDLYSTLTVKVLGEPMQALSRFGSVMALLPARLWVATLAITQLAGCASVIGSAIGDAAYSKAFRIEIEDASKLPEEQLMAVRAMPILSTESVRIYTVLGTIQGLACKLSIGPLIPVWVWNPQLSLANGNTPEEAAMMQLKLAVKRVGGNALVAPSCTHKDGVDWGNNCFESWICSGQAVVLSPEDAATR